MEHSTSTPAVTPVEELREAAIEAVEKARAENPGALLKIKACRLLRDATGAGLIDIVPAIDWALAQPRTTLTRAEKKRAVDEMTRRLEATACKYERHRTGHDAEDYARRLRRRHAALVRLAMARTTEEAR